MKIRRISKGFLSVLLTLTMLVGMVPLSAIPTNAATTYNDRFTAAYNWASAQTYNSPDYHSNFVGKALHYNGFENVPTNLTSTASCVSYVSQIANSTISAGSMVNGTHYIVTGGSYICFYYNGNYVWVGGGGTVKNSNVYGIPTFVSSLTTAYSLVETVTTVDNSDIGSGFYAFITVKGNQFNYAKSLAWTGDVYSDLADRRNVCVTDPNYQDPKQLWYFERRSDNYYCIKNVAQGTYINQLNGNTDQLCTAGSPGGDNYRWGFVKTADTTVSGITWYHIIPKSDTSKCLNVYSNTGKPYVVGKSDTGTNTQFCVMKINSIATDKYVSMQSLYDIKKNPQNTRVAVNDEGTDVQFRSDKSGDPARLDTQLWTFELASDGIPPIYRIKRQVNI